MRTRNRLSLLVFGSLALAAVIWACQVQDGSLPTEADRSIQQSVTASEINAMISALLPPALGASAKSQFKNVETAMNQNKLAEARTKATSLVDFLLKHYQAGKWPDPGPPAGDKTGDLVAAIFEFVGLTPDAQNATACIPNVDCDLTATNDNEFAGTQIPGSSITQPFVIFVSPIECNVDPPLFGLCYEIGTIPAGITFPPAPTGSLTLASEDDQPVVGICTLDSSDPNGVPAGVPQDSLFVVHKVNGQWVRLPQVTITFLDCSTASSEIASAGFFSSPVDFALAPLIDLLTPKSLTAAGTRTGGAITSFSEHATEVAGPLPTTTSLSIVEGSTFFAGDTITLRAEITPDVTGGNVVFFATIPVNSGAPIEPVVDGVAIRKVVCGSARVPFGSHTARAQYLGQGNFQGSTSTLIPYTCNAD